jgi:hypothetical protein
MAMEAHFIWHSVSFEFSHNICEVFVTHFYDRYIQIPKDNALQEIRAGFGSLIGIFYMWELIDGTHICLTTKIPCVFFYQTLQFLI